MQPIQFGGIYKLNMIDETSPRTVTDQEVEEVQDKANTPEGAHLWDQYTNPNDGTRLRAEMLADKNWTARQDAVNLLDKPGDKALVVRLGGYEGENDYLIRDDENGDHYSQLVEPAYAARDQLVRSFGVDPEQAPLDRSVHLEEALMRDSYELAESKSKQAQPMLRLFYDVIREGLESNGQSSQLGSFEDLAWVAKERISNPYDQIKWTYQDAQFPMIQNAKETGTLKQLDVAFEDNPQAGEGQPSARLKSINIQG
jgi:hypothetical protein